MSDRLPEISVSPAEPGSPAAQPRGQAGRFASPYPERRGETIALRLPQSLDRSLRRMIGWQSKADNADLKAWIEAAILEKLDRQRQENW
ncbi:MAG: hypothetical protein ACFCVD_21325 [Nodosilinea sp.]